MVKFKPNYEGKVRAYLNKLNRIRNKDGGYTDENIEKYRQICFIITSFIEDKEKYEYEFYEKISSYVLREKKINYELLVNFLNEKRTNNVYSIIALSNMAYESFKEKQIPFLNNDIFIYNLKEVNEKYNLLKAYRENDVSDEIIQKISKLSFFVVEIEAGDNFEAFMQGNNLLEILRGLVNFSLHVFTSHWSYSRPGGEQIDSTFEPYPIILTISKTDGITTFGYNFNYNTFKENKIEKGREELTFKWIKQVGGFPDCSLRIRFLNSLKKYNYGLDGNVIGTSFLEYWKIFELVALSDLDDKGIPESKVIKRLSVMFIKDYEYHYDTLMALCLKRNYLTHLGVLPDYTQDDLNLIRYYCDQFIRFLAWAVNELKDESSLLLYYEYLPRSNFDLDNTIKIITKIKTDREKKRTRKLAKK